MSTRGIYGFRKNGEDKLTYNHYDSYFSYLGENIINFVKETPIQELNKIYDNLILVSEDDIPTKEQWKHLNECNIEKPEKSVYTLVKTMSKNKLSERLFFLKFPNASLIEANGRQFYFNPVDEAKTIYERVGDSYYKYKLSFDDELLPIIQNAINNAELHQAKLKQKDKDKSYSYER